MLWDKHHLHTGLPYQAVVPWPKIYIESTGQEDWIECVYTVEDWLSHRVGPHYVEWAWNMWALHQSNLCGVSFKHQRSVSMFLLRFGV